MVALAVRLAHSLELNLETSVSAHSPFEAEVRRRLWFGINILDVRSSEDRGSAALIVPGSFDTKMPSNVNDADFGPLSSGEISDRLGCTEMTFNLITNEASVFARIWALPAYNPEISQDSTTGWYEFKAQAEKLCETLQRKYLAHCDTSIPLHWVCNTVATLIGYKLQLLLQYPLQGRGLVPKNERNKEKSMDLAISLLEKTEAIDTTELAAQYKWFLKTYVQWHPLAVVLAELCVEPGGPFVDRAWAVVNRMMSRLGDRIVDSKKGTLWRPLKKLFAKAQAAKVRYDKMHSNRSQNPETPTMALGLGDISSLKLEDAPMPTYQLRDPFVMPSEDVAGLNYAYGGLPEMDFSTDASPMDLEGWDEFLKSTATLDDPNAGQINGEVGWSIPFSMGSVLP